MKSEAFTLIMVGLLTCPAPATAGELCQHLKAFAQTESEHPGERTWFEIHRGNDQTALWSSGCRYSQDKISQTTCRWLLHNSSIEFVYSLPQSIMSCYGYRFPKFAQYDWSGLSGSIVLRGDNGQRLTMDLDFHSLPNHEVAIRVSREALGEEYRPDELPPIAPLSKAP